MIEKIKEIGRKSFKFALKVIAAFFFYFLGAITGPKNWNFVGFIERIAHDPKWTFPILSFIAIVFLFVAFIFSIKIFFKEE